VKAVQVGLAAAGGGHPRRAWHTSELQHARAGPRPEGAAALYRGTRDAGKGEGCLGEGIATVVVRLREDPPPPQQAQHAGAGGGGVAGRGGSAASNRRLL